MTKLLFILLFLFGCSPTEPEPTFYDLYCSQGYVQLWGQFFDIASTIELDLYQNNIQGIIPEQIGCLENLTYLRLSDNQLSGGIPSALGSLTNLTYLNLAQNDLSGEIPSDLSNLTNLERLYLSYNQLSGGVPSWIGTLPNLTSCTLYYNQLSGEIPQEVCDHFNNYSHINYLIEGNNLINTCD